MRSLKMYVVAVIAITIAACSTWKKSKTPDTPAPSPSVTTMPVIPGITPAMRSKDGVYAPGNDELTAIRTKYPMVTMQVLTDGYTIYTGACTNCHGTKNIYNRPADAWPGILDDMAPKANITAAQKDAVYKYVLAIKATQL